MSEALVKPTLNADIVSAIVLKGDISSLNPTETIQYYRSVCERLGLDPVMQPFQLLNLNGKHVLYATKAATEQLSRKWGVSHDIRERQTVEGVFIVYVRASAEGRFTDASGAVNIKGLGGDNLANAMMKAETKAKRRATLSLLGLGMMDETEVETVAGAEKIPIGEVAKVDLGDRTEHEEEKTTQPARSQGSSDIRHPSEAQLKRLFAIAKSEGTPNPTVKTVLKKRYGLDESKDLTIDQYNELCGDKEKNIKGLLSRLALADPDPETIPSWPDPLPAENATLALLASNIRGAESRKTLEEMLANVRSQFDNKSITLDQSILLQEMTDRRYAQLR